MSGKQPPRLGTALLERFGAGNAALIGDLAEESRSGRSAFWYWRQVITIVVIGSVEDIRQHWFLALRAIGVGWLATWILWQWTRPINRVFPPWVLDQLIFNFGSHPLVMLWATDISGWPRLMATHLIAGWVVAAMHRPHAGLLLAFVMITFTTAFVHALSTMLVPLYPGHVGHPHPEFHLISRTLIPPLFVLVGGMLALRRHGTAIVIASPRT